MKFLVSFFLLMGITFVSAQSKIMQIYKDGSVIYSISTSQIDSIKFADNNNSIDDGISLLDVSVT